MKQTNANVNAETNDGDMMINVESDPNIVAETRLLSEPTTELYFSMPSSSKNIRTGGSFVAPEACLPEKMVSNSSCTANFPDGDSDFLIDRMDFGSGLADEAADYFSPESKIM